MMQFAWSWMFFLLPLPLLVRWLWPSARAARDAALTVPFYAAFATLATPPMRTGGVWWRVAGLFLVWLLLLIAAARPQRLGDVDSLPVTGRDLMLAVDLSGSMEMPDLELNGKQATRLQVVQAVAGDFIARRAGDRVGLILFGKRAYVQTPLTFDRATTRAMLDEAEIGLAGKETAIGDAIAVAIKHLRDVPQASRVLVLLTDGANTAGELAPAQAAGLAAQYHVRIYTIGVGADTMDVGALMGGQSFNGLTRKRMINPSADLDEKLLKHIAESTGGRYFRARDSAGLEDVYRALDQLEPSARADEIIRPVAELYYWPLAAGFGVGMALAGWRVTRQRVTAGAMS
jgi:Ca-activated chloride channel family protein